MYTTYDTDGITASVCATFLISKYFTALIWALVCKCGQPPSKGVAVSFKFHETEIENHLLEGHLCFLN